MVLVGRYDSCVGGVNEVFSDSVSRIHLGLVRDGDAVEVLDLGSTNGIQRDGREFRRLRVSDSVVVQLGDGDELVQISMRR